MMLLYWTLRRNFVVAGIACITDNADNADNAEIAGVAGIADIVGVAGITGVADIAGVADTKGHHGVVFGDVKPSDKETLALCPVLLLDTASKCQWFMVLFSGHIITVLLWILIRGIIFLSHRHYICYESSASVPSRGLSWETFNLDTSLL
ncbi:hypothetical protein MFLAVUS_000701 [Mucor flavus]|uniref:Uncharacterized protein n=1 Tax=Mucor flavus TaxID=439312 RepID=A0ABP9YKF4_9FUNG